MRAGNYVRADKVLALRSLLKESCPDVHGLMDQEMDPEELLFILLDRVLRPRPYIRLRYVRTRGPRGCVRAGTARGACPR